MYEYVNGFSSRYGVMEAIDYLKLERKKRGYIYIIVRNDHGNPEDAIIAAFVYNNDYGLYVLNKPLEQLKQEGQNNTFQGPLYFVSRGSYYAGLEKALKNQKKFLKPNDAEYVGVSELDITKL